MLLEPDNEKRRRRTKAQVATLDAQIMAVLEADHPQSCRHVYYRVTDPRLEEPVEKTEHGYGQILHRMKVLRRSGRLRYGWVSDTTRRGYHVDTFASGAEFLRRVKGMYRADLWASTPYHVEVWTESRSIAGVVEGDCRELAVSLYPCGGFASITLAYEAVEQVAADHEEPVEWIIFYIGDYDPSGVLIDVSLERELMLHLEDHPHIELRFERIAITEEQIAEYDLPTKPRKKGDKRVLHIEETVEAEAMPAHILRDMLRDRIEALLPPRALEVARAAEKAERDAIDILAMAAEGPDD